MEWRALASRLCSRYFGEKKKEDRNSRSTEKTEKRKSGRDDAGRNKVSVAVLLLGRLLASG